MSLASVQQVLLTEVVATIFAYSYAHTPFYLRGTPLYLAPPAHLPCSRWRTALPRPSCPLTCHATVGSGFWAPEVIGDFQEGDARRFLEMRLRLKRSSVTVDDIAWAKVYEVLHP